MATDEVSAELGERCGCGKPATLAFFLTERWGRVPWCGVFDDGDYAAAGAEGDGEGDK
jgi:hypothetical protein